MIGCRPGVESTPIKGRGVRWRRRADTVECRARLRTCARGAARPWLRLYRTRGNRRLTRLSSRVLQLRPGQRRLQRCHRPQEHQLHRRSLGRRLARQAHPSRPEHRCHPQQCHQLQERRLRAHPPGRQHPAHHLNQAHRPHPGRPEPFRNEPGPRRLWSRNHDPSGHTSPSAAAHCCC